MAALGGGGAGSWFDVSADVDRKLAKVGGSPVYVKNSPPEQEPVRTAKAITARMTRPTTFMAAPGPRIGRHRSLRITHLGTLFYAAAPGFGPSSLGCSG
jgi:hypothetical protein